MVTLRKRSPKQNLNTKKTLPRRTKHLWMKRRRTIFLPPEVIDQVKEKDPERAQKLQSRYDQKLEGAKEYDRYRKEASRTMSRLEEEKNNGLAEVQKIDQKIKKLHDEYEYLRKDNEMGGMIASDEDLAHRGFQIDNEVDDLRKQRNQLLANSELVQDRINTMESSNALNLERRKQGLPIQHSHLMPEKFAGYFADTEKKHFSDNSAGSTFTEAKNLNEVLSKAAQQRKNLEGDDREKLIARGADPKSFTPDKRYLMVETKGKLGTVLASELNDNDTVTVVQKSEKSKPVCVTEVKNQRETDFATIVLVDNPSLPGTEKHPSLLITAYPGASGPSGSNNDLLPHVGKSMSVAEARKIYGRDFTINTVVK